MPCSRHALPLWLADGAARSLKIAATHIEPCEQGREVAQAAGDEMSYAAGRLQMAIYTKQLRLEQGSPLALGQVAPDHHVDHAELVFQGNEYDTAGGLWALSADHQAGNADRAAMLDRAQFPRTAAAPGLELIS